MKLQIFLLFSPLPWGRWSPTWRICFQMGWNHQLVLFKWQLLYNLFKQRIPHSWKRRQTCCALSRCWRCGHWYPTWVNQVMKTSAWLGKHVPSRELTYPTLGKGKSRVQNWLFRGYVSCQVRVGKVYKKVALWSDNYCWMATRNLAITSWGW